MQVRIASYRPAVTLSIDIGIHYYMLQYSQSPLLCVHQSAIVTLYRSEWYTTSLAPGFYLGIKAIPSLFHLHSVSSRADEYERSLPTW